jgi:hypothetical protein
MSAMLDSVKPRSVKISRAATSNARCVSAVRLHRHAADMELALRCLAMDHHPNAHPRPMYRHARRRPAARLAGT